MNTDIIAKINERDHIFGKLCFEAQNSYEQENYFSALACLFVLSEQIIKFSVNKIDGNFHRIITEAKEKDLIDDAELKFLESLREIRNKLFHESHYPTGLEINGKFWSFGEDETRELIYKDFSPKIFSLVFKLLAE
ncbi:MAG TPA: hypothetical protein P5096_02705 [Patescibacteria group bacterium]|nr:hypothetical protein [Patescibacteria group bacterium]